MFKVNKKTQERRQWHRSGVFIINFDHISHLVLVFLLLTLNEHAIAGWVLCLKTNLVTYKTGMVYNPSVVFALNVFTPSFELMEFIVAFIFFL